MNKILAALLIIFSNTIFAQDQVAKNVLDQLSTTTKGYKNMTIVFDFIFENKSQNMKEEQKGKLVLEGNNFSLEMDAQTIINDGVTQWVYLTDMNEVQIMEHDSEDEMMSPSKLFTIYEKDYKYTYLGAESSGRKRLHIIDLFPEESEAFIKIQLAIDAGKNQLNKIIMYDKNGGTYTYLVSTFNSNTKVKPFSFNTINYPGVEVIDLR